MEDVCSVATLGSRGSRSMPTTTPVLSVTASGGSTLFGSSFVCSICRHTSTYCQGFVCTERCSGQPPALPAVLWTVAGAACTVLDRRLRCLHCSGPPPALPALLAPRASHVVPRTCSDKCLMQDAGHTERHRVPSNSIGAHCSQTTRFFCHRTHVCLPLVALWWQPVATRVADFFITKLWIQMTLGIQ